MGASLTLSDVQMLPVARLAGYYRQTRLRSSTASPTPDDRVRPVHVHVGAGRLALGLVLPALVRGAAANKGAIVLLQRPQLLFVCLSLVTPAEDVHTAVKCALLHELWRQGYRLHKDATLGPLLLLIM